MSKEKRAQEKAALIPLLRGPAPWREIAFRALERMDGEPYEAIPSLTFCAIDSISFIGRPEFAQTNTEGGEADNDATLCFRIWNDYGLDQEVVEAVLDEFFLGLKSKVLPQDKLQELVAGVLGTPRGVATVVRLLMTDWNFWKEVVLSAWDETQQGYASASTALIDSTLQCMEGRFSTEGLLDMDDQELKDSIRETFQLVRQTDVFWETVGDSATDVRDFLWLYDNDGMSGAVSEVMEKARSLEGREFFPLSLSCLEIPGENSEDNEAFVSFNGNYVSDGYPAIFWEHFYCDPMRLSAFVDEFECLAQGIDSATEEDGYGQAFDPVRPLLLKQAEAIRSTYESIR